ncbi:MAG: DUF2127 domain-containing protein [Lysobacter sp.]|nr:MAG: DUF2127 domain-containing protein [Lysobacter sp.]
MAGAPQPLYDRNPRAHPGLRAIALVEGIKGLLGVLAASGMEILGPDPLRNAVHWLIRYFHLSPTEGALAWLAGAINPGSVHATAALATAYGILHLFEAWGLWRDRAWASWLGCVAAAIYLPFDIYALWHHPGVTALSVLMINLLIVWVLARDLSKRSHLRH